MQKVSSLIKTQHNGLIITGKQ